jgi:hypothetical protein
VSAPHVTLPSAGMEFAAVGELAVGPFAGFCGGGRTRYRRRYYRFRAPVFGGWMDPPDIPRLVQCDSYDPALASASQGHAIGNPGSHAHAGRKFVQKDFRSRLQRTRKPNAAPLRIDHQGVPRFREWGGRLQGSNPKWNLGANSGASPSRIYRFFFFQGHKSIFA